MGQLEKPKRKPPQPDWITVFITHDLQEAHIIAGKLNAFDIQSMIMTVPGASAIGITIGSLGEIKVLVHPDNYDEAYDLLFPPILDEIEENNDPINIIWQDENGDEYYLDDDDDQ